MKAKLNSIFTEIQGKLEELPDGSIMTTRMRNGKPHIYIQKKQTGERTEEQKANSNRFKTAHQQAKAAYHDPVLCQQFQAEYDQNGGIFNKHKYTTLYNYIYAKKSNELKPVSTLKSAP